MGRDLAAITQGTGAASLNETLFEALAPLGASAEIFAPTVLRGEPVFVRGVDPVAFFRLEGVSGSGPFDSAFAAHPGRRLAERLSLAVGDRIMLPGLAVSGIVELHIDAIFSSNGPRDDEILVSLPVGRALADLPADYFHIIRMPPANLGPAFEILRAHRASVHVSSPGLPRVDVNSGPATDDRIANLAFRTGVAGTSTNYVPTIIGLGESSVRTVVLGLGAMVVLLVGIGSHAVQARLLADKQATFATVRALGAPRRWILATLAREAAGVGAIAIAVGAAAGFAASLAVGAYGGVVVFGHLVQPEVSAPLAALVLTCGFAVLVGTALLAARPFLGGPPRHVIVESRAHVRLEAVLE